MERSALGHTLEAGPVEFPTMGQMEGDGTSIISRGLSKSRTMACRWLRQMRGRRAWEEGPASVWGVPWRQHSVTVEWQQLLELGAEGTDPSRDGRTGPLDAQSHPSPYLGDTRPHSSVPRGFHFQQHMGSRETQPSRQEVPLHAL